MGPEGTLIRVEVDRPGPGEELNTGAPTEPRPAATVIVLRGGSARLEALLVQRNPAARFMGGAWVFPGGALGDFPRGTTPPEVGIPSNTLFRLAPAPGAAGGGPEGGETVDAAC